MMIDIPLLGTIKKGFDTVRGIIDELNTSDEERAKIKAAVEKAERETLAQTQAHTERMAQMQVETIKQEANSEDAWTSRARPTFMYVIYLVIVLNVILAPVLSVFYPDQLSIYFSNIGKGFEAIPNAVWATFTAGYLGYAGFRTYEKRHGVAGKQEGFSPSLTDKARQQIGL